MPRVRHVTMDDLALAVSPLSFDEAQVHLDKTKVLLDAKDPATTPAQWVDRTVETVVFALNRALTVKNGDGANNKWTPEKLKSELDMVFIRRLYEEIMEMSGLREAQPGEGRATPTGR